MKACAAGARCATFILFATSFFSLIVGFKLRPSNGAQRTLFCGAKKEKWRRRQKNFKVQPGWCGQQPSSQGYCVLPWFNHGSFPHISPPPPEIQIYIFFFPPKNFRIRFLNLILSTKLIPWLVHFFSPSPKVSIRPAGVSLIRVQGPDFFKTKKKICTPSKIMDVQST